MSASLADIRAGLKQVISNFTETPIYTYDSLVEAANLPCAVITLDPTTMSVNYDEDMGDGACWYLYIYVLCGTSMEMSYGEAQLDGFIDSRGPDSIPAIIKAHSDLNLDGVDAHPLLTWGYGGTHDSAKIPLVGAVIKVRVYT